MTPEQQASVELFGKMDFVPPDPEQRFVTKSGGVITYTNLVARYRDDWTSRDGRTNSSDEFTRLAADVERIIRASAHSLIGGNVESVARHIVAWLAHTHGMRPRG